MKPVIPRAALIDLLELIDHYLAWGKVTEARELITERLEELYDESATGA